MISLMFWNSVVFTIISILVIMVQSQDSSEGEDWCACDTDECIMNCLAEVCNCTRENESCMSDCVYGMSSCKLDDMECIRNFSKMEPCTCEEGDDTEECMKNCGSYEESSEYGSESDSSEEVRRRKRQVSTQGGSGRQGQGGRTQGQQGQNRQGGQTGQRQGGGQRRQGQNGGQRGQGQNGGQRGQGQNGGQQGQGQRRGQQSQQG